MSYSDNPTATWREVVLKYASPRLRTSLWQLLNSLVPYFLLLILMTITLQWSYWITLLLSVFAAAFLVRLFIIFHDCGHGSFFKSARISNITGVIFGILTFTPYYKWHRSHKIHHATVGDLDKRGIGDVWVLTVDEYRKLSKWRKFFYRMYRNPFIMFLIGAPLIFLLINRLTTKSLNSRERMNVYVTNIAILLILVVAHLTIGLKVYLLIQFPVIYLASVFGVWLFYVQHQYEGVHWYRNREWDYKTVALMGSSFYKLPSVLQWFSGNIGFHHIHHLSPKIPNYKLAQCQRENMIFSDVHIITLRTGLRSLKLRLWDEETRKLISMHEYKLTALRIPSQL